MLQLLYRVQIKKSLQLLIAPLGGSIDALSRAITPIQGRLASVKIHAALSQIQLTTMTALAAACYTPPVVQQHCNLT
jgi:hypothetical protein